MAKSGAGLKCAGHGRDRGTDLKAKKFLTSDFFAAGIIALITILLYWKAGGAGFVSLDDTEYIINDHIIKDLSWDGILEMFTSFRVANYHPLTTLSWAIEYKLYGYDPAMFHRTNVALHILNTLLVFMIARKLSGQILTAAVTSLFFGIHPMHVESVAWISARKDVLFSLFFIFSILSYIKFTDNRKKGFWYAASLILFIASLLSKAAAVVLPMVLLLIDHYRKHKISRADIIEKMPFFALATAVGVLAYFAQHSVGAVNPLPGYHIADRILVILYALAHYLVSSLVPYKLSVMHFYPDKSGGWLPWYFYAAPLLLAAIVFAIYKAQRLRREPVFGALFFMITIFLVIEIIPLGPSMLAERYTYLPYIAVFYFLGQCWSLKLWLNKKKARIVRVVMPAVLIPLAIGFWFMSSNRIEVWKTSEQLFSDVMGKYPNHYYGYYYTAKTLFDQQRFTEALPLYDKAISLDSSLHHAWNNRGVIKYTMMDYQGSVEDYTMAIRVSPKFATAYQNRGSAFANLKRYQEALSDFSKAISLKPDYAEAHRNRGNVYLLLKDMPNACDDWQKAAKLGNKEVIKVIDRYCK